MFSVMRVAATGEMALTRMLSRSPSILRVFISPTRDNFAAAGAFAVAKIYETEGCYLGDHLSAEAVRDNWSRITDPTGEQSYTAGQEQTQKFMRRVMGQ